MTKTISHSAYKKYLTCPKMYDYHYNEKIRPTGTTTALIFGTAIDEALNSFLMKEGKTLKVFRKTFHDSFTEDVMCDHKDIDLDIVGEEAKHFKTKLMRRGWGGLTDAERKTVQELSKKSLTFVGEMLLVGYKDLVAPHINEVISIQRETTERRGFIDAMLDIKGHGICTVDHKTAGRAYQEDQILWDTQLPLYNKETKTDKVAFIVLVKELGREKTKTCKKCGHKFSSSHTTCPKTVNGVRCKGLYDQVIKFEPIIQLMVDKLPKHNVDLVCESVKQVEQAIQQKHFPRNLAACGKIYGKPCPYANLCWKNDMKGLKKND